MANGRVTPHRVKKDTQEIRAKEVAEYRTEAQRLRRENARLRRELQKMTSTFAPDVQDEETTMERKVVEAASIVPGCPRCNSSSIATVKIGAKSIFGCKGCGYREVR